MDVQVVAGKPADEILRVAREQRVDLIVMGTHGRTGLRQTDRPVGQAKRRSGQQPGACHDAAGPLSIGA